MSATAASAREYLLSTELPEPGELGVPAAGPGLLEGDENPLDQSRTQAIVVGSNVLATETGMPVASREVIANSLLLAQLVVKKKQIDASDAQAYHSAYGEVLRSLGWILTGEENTRVDRQGMQFEVHEAILAVAQVALGGAPGALKIVQIILSQLAATEPHPWITIFNRETKASKTSNFQLSYTQQQGDQIAATLMSFSLEANSAITQVLVFRGGDESVTFSSSRSGAQINMAVVDFIKDDLRTRLQKYVQNYISTLPDLD
ncbi:hypothetical protein SAMN02787142_3216 [Burkholderia sp. WP9]|uniref:hypothetical protein n=1 Tax=Burkholderia sp. WP9 TaxID=1500263 RepID=UPI00089988E3|nr:hypothetical protein [Burkholderia sp. WP9]SED46570.1 hypothetical protein SAMN02787142_3216 [Burkholderia sp. WP9]